MEKKNFEESSMNIFKNLLKYSIFITYYNIISRQFSMNIFYIALQLVSTIQIAAILICHISYNNNPLSISNYPSDLISFAKNIVLLYPNGNFVFANIILYLILAFLILQFSIFFFYFFNNNTKILKGENTKKHSFNDLFFSFILIINLFQQTLLAIPIFITLFSFFQCNSNSTFNSYYLQICYTNYHYFIISISSLCLFLYLVIIILNIMFLNDNRPVSKLPSSGSSKITRINKTLLNLILSFCFTFNFGNILLNFKVILMNLILMTETFNLIISPLYHQKIVFKFSVFFNGNLVFISIFSLINFYSNTVYNIQIIAVIILSSISFGLFFLMLIEKFQIYYAYRQKIETNRPLFAINMLTLLIEDSKDFNSNNINRLRLLEILNFHKFNCTDENCPCKRFMKILNIINFNNFDKGYIDNEEKINSLSRTTDNVFNNPNELSLSESIYGTINLFINEYMNNFPKNIDLTIIYANFMTYFIKNIYKALFEIMKISKHKASLMDEFDVFFLHNEIEKIMYSFYLELKKEFIDIERTLRYNNLSSTMLDKMQNTAQTCIEFWMDVKSDFNKSKIYDSAVKISKNIKIIKENFDELVNKFSYKNVKLLILYKDFLEKIIFYEQDCREIKEKIKQYNQITDSANDYIEFKDNLMSNIIVNNLNIGTAVISGNLTDLGEILSVNLTFCKLFKYEMKTEILRKSIKTIIPYYISQHHDNFIKRYFDTAKKNILDKDRNLFGLNFSGFVIPIILHTKIIPNLDKSIRFIGYMKKMEKNHPFYKTRIDIKNPNVSFLLSTNEGYVFGISKLACIEFGVPLNIILNAKLNSDQSKKLSIKSLFPEINLDDPAINKKLSSENGLQTKLDSRILKDFFDDFKETCTEVSKIKKIFENDFTNKFVLHDVHVYMKVETISYNKLILKILKIVKLDNDSNNEQKIDLNIKINEISNKEKDITKELTSSIKNNTPVSEDKEIKIIKEELHKSKKNLLKIKYPKQIKLFLLYITFFILIVLLTGFLEMYLNIKQFSQISIFFNIWIPYLKKNIYFTDMIMCFQSILLIQNGFYSNIYSNKTAQLTLLQNKIIYDLNRSILNVNNLTYQMSTVYDNISNIYSIEKFQIQGESSIENNTYAFENNNLNVRASKIVSDNYNLTFNNIFNLFNYNYSINLNESTNLLNYQNFNNNSLTVFRFYTEKINENFRYLLQNSSFMTFSQPSYLCIFGILTCFLMTIALFRILSKITIFKIKILKIFSLIDKKWADIIIKRCKIYIERSENFLINKENGKSQFFSNKDVVNKKYTNTFVKDSKIEANKKKNSKNKLNDNDPVNPEIKEGEFDDENQDKQEEKNDIEVMNALINKFRKKRWFFYLKIIILIIIILIFFIERIVLDIVSNPLSSQKLLFQQITDRAWNYNNLALFYRSMIMQGKIKLPLISNYIDFSQLNTVENLDSYDLFNLYSSKVTNIESNILIGFNGNSGLLTLSSNMEKSLSSNLFCSTLNNYDIDFYNNFQTQCNTFNQAQNKVGLKNLIAFSSNFFSNNFNNYFTRDYNLNMTQIKSYLVNSDLAYITDTNFLFINQAFLLLLDNFSFDISNFNNYNQNFSIIKFSLFIGVLIIELICFIIISNSMKKMINKDKAILAIIPSEAISNNEKMNNAFQELKI